MAEALTRPKRNRRGKAADPRERELKRLKLSVCDDTGFRLLLATYDQPRRRDELIAEVVTEAKAEKVQITRLDLAEGGRETNLVGLLRANLADTELPDGWRQAVMVTGIEQRIDYSSGNEGFAFLHQANLLRDALTEAAPVPVVLWLSRMASAALPAEAPDLWHWRAANFDFTGDKAPRLELLRELTTHRQEDEGGSSLSVEQRRARVRMLKELLAEVEREGPPKTKRQAGERAAILMDLGIQVFSLWRAAEALPYIEQALAIYEELGFVTGEALALRVLGTAWEQLGDLRRATEFYEQSLSIARKTGDQRAEGAALSHLGDLWVDLGETRRAIGYLEQALAIARKTGDRRYECEALTDLGDAWAKLGETRQAIAYFGQALAIAREIGDQRDEGKALRGMGDAYAGSGERRLAITYFEQALGIAREIGHQVLAGRTLSDLGKTYRHLGEPQRAIEHYEHSLTIARQMGNRMIEGWRLWGLCLAYYDLGNWEQANKTARAALAIGEAIGATELADAARKQAQFVEWAVEQAKKDGNGTN